MKVSNSVWTDLQCQACWYRNYSAIRKFIVSGSYWEDKLF